MRIIGNRGNTARKVQAVASGALASGDTVVVNADGTVSVAAAVSASTGSKSAFNSINTSFCTSVFDSSNNKHIIVYRSGTATRYIVATVASNGSVSYGTDAQIDNSDNDSIAACFDSTNNRIVIVFRYGGDSNHGYARVGSLSGTTVSWGNPTEFNNANTGDISISFDSTAGKVVIGYFNYGNSQYGTAIVGTVSGTSISFGTAVVYNSQITRDNRAIYDSANDKTVIAFRDRYETSNDFGLAIVGTISGTGISFGSSQRFSSASTGGVDHVLGTFDSSNNKIFIAYKNMVGNANSGTAVVGTVSGTSITFGTPVEFDAGTFGEEPECVFDTNANKVIIAYKVTVSGSYSNHGYAIAGAVSGTSITFDPKVAYNAATTRYPAISFDSNVNKNLIPFSDGGNSEYGYTNTFSPISTNLTAENYIGIASNGYATGQAATINAKGFIDDNQSSLTAGQSYYVQTNGDLGLTAADPSVFAGTAVSATKLIVKG